MEKSNHNDPDICVVPHPSALWLSHTLGTLFSLDKGKAHVTGQQHRVQVRRVLVSKISHVALWEIMLKGKLGPVMNEALVY